MKALSSSEGLASHPNKNSNNRKIESVRGTMGRANRRELLLFPLPIVPLAIFFLQPSLQYKEDSAEERVVKDKITSFYQTNMSP